MMTIDIETMGLMHHKPFPAMTCACLYDGVTQYQILFTGVSAVQHKANAAQLVALLDSAERLAGIRCSSVAALYHSQTAKQPNSQT